MSINKKKIIASKISSNVVQYIILISLAVILLFPYFYMVVNSLKTIEEIENPRGSFFPESLQFKNYITVFNTNGYGKAILTTLVIILFNLFVVPLSASFIAYSFAKLKWKGRKVMFTLMLGTMMLPSAVTQLPLYIIYSKIGFLNTIKPFTIPNIFGGGAIYIFLIVQFMKSLPNELRNAAQIDGASEFRCFFQIFFPLCKPILIYVMVQVFLAYWGDYYGPLVYLTSAKSNKTVALVMYNFITDNSTGAKTNILMAGAVFMSIIPTIIFAIFQRQLIDGVMVGSLKG